MRRATAAIVLCTHVIARTMAPASIAERTERRVRAKDEPKVSWDGASIRDPLPYGKRARRQLRGGKR